MAGEQFFCEKCKRTKSKKEFYSTNNTEKYPEGVLHQCKSCITMHVDNWNPDTYLWILQECDVPYIPRIWDGQMAKWCQDKSKVNGTTIVGRYLSIMQIQQYRKWRWADTAYIQELEDKQKTEAMMRQGYDMQQIDKVLREGHFEVPTGELEQPPEPAPVAEEAATEDYFDRDMPQEDFVNDLTEEEKLRLRLKWGKTYRVEEWVRLEQLYNEMCDSYDIQLAGHEDVLKLVCKTSLKANQLLDMQDVDGAQKMIKMYDSLMKSGKFTAAQNKAENGEFIDSISEFVALCERDGFIERYYTDGPKDKVDETIADLKAYTHSLVTEEMNLGNLIENAVKQMTIEESKEEDEDTDDEDEITLEELDELRDQDFEDYEDFLDEEAEEDEKEINEL